MTCRHTHPKRSPPVSEAQFRSELEDLLRRAVQNRRDLAGLDERYTLRFADHVSARHAKDPRAYAEVHAETADFAFAHEARELPDENRIALIAHEIGHVLDPYATENGADRAAERALGIRIVYDPRWPGKGLQALESVPNPVEVRRGGASDFCAQLAEAYDRLPLVQPEELWRWDLLARHIRKLYRQMLSRIDVQFVDGQPYADAEQMAKDVARTGVLLISRDFNDHPVFDPETNLQFRAVHDYVVHLQQPSDFSSLGELRAYNLHRRLAPPDTWPALFTEVAAQACYVNARGDFPVQKAAVLPGFDFYRVGRRKAANTANKLKRRLMR